MEGADILVLEVDCDIENEVVATMESLGSGWDKKRLPGEVVWDAKTTGHPDPSQEDMPREEHKGLRKSRQKRSFPVAAVVIVVVIVVVIAVVAFTAIYLFVGTTSFTILSAINSNKISELQDDYNLIRQENRVLKETLDLLSQNQIDMIERLTELVWSRKDQERPPRDIN